MTSVLLFIIHLVFQLYLLAVFLRFLLQLVKANFYNPICQFIVKVTNPLLIPLRRVVPGWYGIDFASVVLLYVLQVIEIIILFALSYGGFSPLVFLAAVFAILILLLNIYFYLIILRAVASWFQPDPSQPLYDLISVLTEPLLRRLRKVIPVTGMIDWSSLAALVILMVLRMFLRIFLPNILIGWI